MRLDVLFAVTPAPLNMGSWHLPWFSTAFSPYNVVCLGDADPLAANVTRLPSPNTTADRSTSMGFLMKTRRNLVLLVDVSVSQRTLDARLNLEAARLLL